jgi:hypothetical protein
MKKEKRHFRIGKVQAAVFSLLVILSLTIPSYSRVDEAAFSMEFQEVSGASSVNNVKFVFDRYILTAPYAPSEPLSEEDPLEKFDNHYLLLVDGKKMENEPIKIDIGCYFPTKLFYSPESSTVFIKGTEFLETGEGLIPVAVIKYLRLNLSEDNKPIVSGGVQTIRIPGVIEESGYATNAPDLMVINDSDTIFFTNGASVFSFSLSRGFIYKVDLITHNDFDLENNSVSYLSSDSESGTLSILINKKTEIETKAWKHSAELYFFKINRGTLDRLSYLPSSAFPEGVSVPAGSTIAVKVEPGQDPKEDADGYGYFVATNGKLYGVHWKGNSTAEGIVEEQGFFEGLVQEVNAEHLSSVSTKYDKKTKVFELLKNGYTAYIHRPVNARGKIGKIHRPVNIRFTVERPAFILAQFGKKNKVKIKAFTEEFSEVGSLLEPFTDGEGNRYVAASNGSIFTLKVNEDEGVETSKLNLLGQVGDRLDSMVYFAERRIFVGVSSFRPFENGEGIEQPGYIVAAKRKESGNYISFVSFAADALSNQVLPGIGLASIRRPCNTRPQ